jgi:hypothetical protein
MSNIYLKGKPDLYRQLRIGSFVFAKGKGRAVTSMIGAGNPIAFNKNEIDVYFDYEVGIGPVGCRMDKIEPISISAEWLVKMGFVEKRKNYFVLLVRRHFMASDINSWRYAYEIGKKKLSFQGVWAFCPEIEYVHELQNYVFETSGHFIEL